MKKYKKSLAVVLGTWGIYFLGLWPRMFFQNSEGIFAGWRTIWPDWAAHMTYSNVFALRNFGDWFTIHPLFLLEKFNYPFVSSLISGLLMRMGMNPVPAFVGPSLIETIIFLIFAFIFLVEVLQSNLKALISLTLFLASGGLGFLTLFFNSTSFSQEFTSIPNLNIHWINIVTSEILPQRSFLLGLSLSFPLLVLLKKWFELDFQISLKKLIFAGLCIGSLILVHTHTFMVMALLLATMFVFKRNRYLFILGAIAALTSLIFYFAFLRLQHSSGFFVWHFGWMARPGLPHFVNFWWLNWGVFLPLSLWSVWKEKLHQNPFVITGISLFIICNFFRISPWDWDNTKLLTWSYFFLTIPLSQYLVRLWKENHLGKVAAVFSFLMMIASGSLDLAKVYFHRPNLMWSKDDIEIAQKFRDISKPTDIAIFAPTDFQAWVSRLSGRQVLLGYTATLWSYGFNYRPVEDDLKKMFQGGEEAEKLFQKYHVSYAVIGESELKDFKANEGYFAQNSEKVLENRRYRVYRLKNS